MNNKLSLAFGDYYARIPLKASPHIHNADALEIDWNTCKRAGTPWRRPRRCARCRRPPPARVPAASPALRLATCGKGRSVEPLSQT
jgi:hypothetical protein